MALFNYATRELSAKVVYYGPGLSGKTTNIEMVHKILRPEQKGRLISLPTETDRTLFFDFLPLDLGQIKGFKVRFHLYTVPGQVFYNATRRLVLQGVDGVVFVADSQVDMMSSNAESLKNLRDNLATYGKKLDGLPFVMQYNKRDLRNIASVKELNAQLNDLSVPFYEGVAKNGVGVAETLVAISRLVFAHLRKNLLLPGETIEAEEPGEVAGVGQRIPSEEAEPLEEISEIEEIPEVHETPMIKEVPETPKIPEASVTVKAAPEKKPPMPPEAPESTVPQEIPEPAAATKAPGTPLEEDAPPVQEIPETTEVPEGVELIIPPKEVSPAPFHDKIPVGQKAAWGEEPLREEPASLPEEIPDEIEIEIPERFDEPPPAQIVRSGISMGVEGKGLTFLNFEDASVSPEGHAVLSAVFLDAEKNTVRIRIRVSIEEGRE